MTIFLENISKSYGSRRVLKHLNIQIEEGRSYHLVGGEGAGKTTALKIFMGHIQPDEGRVVKMGDYKYPTLQTAYVPQESELNRKKNAIWNVKKSRRFASTGSVVSELACFLDEGKMKLPVGELTEVERKYVEIVKALFAPADFIVIDEAFSCMNSQEREKALEYIRNAQGTRPLLIAQREEAGLDFARKIRLG